jgi:hypothetical protein
MKFLSTWLAAACLALTLGCKDSPGGRPEISGSPTTPQVIAKLHFAGESVVAGDQGGTAFKEIWNLPSTAQLRQETLDKLAAAWANRLRHRTDQARPNAVSLLRPLLDDMAQAEWYLELIEHPGQTLEAVWALRLDETRTQLWQANWKQLLAAYDLNTDDRTNRISFLATNSWVVVHSFSSIKGGPAAQLPENDVIRKIRQGQRPAPTVNEHWLAGEGNLPRLAEWSGWTGKGAWPQISFDVSGRGEYLRSQARLNFREPLAPKIERWQIPLETIRDPVISFTAIQGLASWLQRQPFFKELGLQTVPNQLYLWALSQTPFQFQAAVPVADAQAAVSRIQKQFVPQLNRILAENAVGEIQPLTNRAGLFWRGLPIIVPYLNATRDGKQDFLHAGVFPVDPPATPPPPQLIEQLTGAKDLRYFEWEITQERLIQLRPLLQLASVFLTISPMSTNSAAHKWIDAVEPRLGNTVTEVREISPRELHLVRSSHAGLNGIELLTLASWLEGTNFPNAKFDVGFRAPLKQPRQRERH